MSATPESKAGLEFPFVSTGHLPTPEAVTAFDYGSACALQVKHRWAQLSGLPDPGSNTERTVRRMRGRGQRSRLYDWGHGLRIHDYERVEAIRVCDRLSGDRCQASARNARSERHRSTIRLVHRCRAERRWANKPYGECRRNRYYEPRAREDVRCQVALHLRRLDAICRSQACGERGGLRFRLRDQLSQPRDRAGPTALRSNLP